MDHVTETEMRDFFARIVNTVVSLSETAKQVDSLTAQVTELSARLDSMGLENQRLRTSEAEAHELIKISEASEQRAKADLETAQAQVRAYQDAIVNRDSRVTELEAEVTRLKAEAQANEAQFVQTTRERDMLRTENDWFCKDLHRVTDERNTAEAARDKAEASLATIRSHLGLPVSQDVKPAEEPFPDPVQNDQADWPRPVSVSNW